MMLTILPRSKTRSGAAYHECGSGEPLILLHGVGLRAEVWQPQLDALSDRWRIYAVDLPGHGQSKPLSKSADLEDYVSWLEQFIRDLKLGPANIAGHSLGALIALGVTVSAPTLVRRVALLNAVHRRSRQASLDIADRARQISSGRINHEEPLKRWFTSLPKENAARKLTASLLSSVDPRGYATAYSAFARGDSIYADRLSEISCPALFLTGEDDPNSTPEMTRFMASCVVDSVCVVVAGHRHMLGLTAPVVVNEALVSWLERKRQDDTE